MVGDQRKVSTSTPALTSESGPKEVGSEETAQVPVKLVPGCPPCTPRMVGTRAPAPPARPGASAGSTGARVVIAKGRGVDGRAPGDGGTAVACVRAALGKSLAGIEA